jgi:hypothetical protein
VASVYIGEWANGVKQGYGVMDDIVTGMCWKTALLIESGHVCPTPILLFMLTAVVSTMFSNSGCKNILVLYEYETWSLTLKLKIYNGFLETECFRDYEPNERQSKWVV